ncbi:MAG: hypothetical protein ACRD4L_06515 [Pyrinomonadaceae bacterium]
MNLRTLLFFLLVVSSPISAQQGASAGMGGGGKGKRVDLGELAQSRCKEALFFTAGSSQIDIRFPTGFSIQAEEVSQQLIQVVGQMQKTLYPLSVGNVRLYLLPMNKAPDNYVYYLYGDSDTHQTIGILTEPTRVKDCQSNLSLCSEIFTSTPHELTHYAMRDLIGEPHTRWFNEGFAEYIKWKIASEFEPSLANNFIKNHDPEYLFKEKELDIRRRLLIWKNFTEFPTRKQVNDSKWAKEIYFMYAGSFQLVRLIMEKSDTKNPVGLLVQALIDQHTKEGRAANSEEIIAIIKDILHVDVNELIESKN